MAEVLLIQGADPPFRLAAWVLQEEGFTVRIVARAEDSPVEFPENPPDLIVVNAVETPEQHSQSVHMLRAVAPDAPIVHVASETAKGLPVCACDQLLPPPHSGPALLEAASRLLASR